MKVDYDSEARSLLFEFGEFREYEDGDYVEELTGGSCIVWIHDGLVDSIQLLDADKDIAPLDEAADRFRLDADRSEGGRQGRTRGTRSRDHHRTSDPAASWAARRWRPERPTRSRPG